MKATEKQISYAMSLLRELNYSDTMNMAEYRKLGMHPQNEGDSRAGWIDSRDSIQISHVIKTLLQQKKAMKVNRENLGKVTKILAVPHQYSCGGYWLAVDQGENRFWCLSPTWGQGCVLSAYQAKEVTQDNFAMRGEIAEVEFVSGLPEGAVVVNIQSADAPALFRVGL